MHTNTDPTAHAPQPLATGQANSFYAARAGGPGVLDRFSVDSISQRQGAGRVRNSCHRCGATAYKTVMTRNEAGVMSASGRYQCVQCRQVFSTVLEWRDGLPQ
jgi:hypothetical protein